MKYRVALYDYVEVKTKATVATVENFSTIAVDAYTNIFDRIPRDTKEFDTLNEAKEHFNKVVSLNRNYTPKHLGGHLWWAKVFTLEAHTCLDYFVPTGGRDCSETLPDAELNRIADELHESGLLAEDVTDFLLNDGAKQYFLSEYEIDLIARKLGLLEN